MASKPDAAAELHELIQLLETTATETGRRLIALVEESPVLLVFLRHAGCTFCREALADIAASRARLEERGTRIVLVYMGDLDAMNRLIRKRDLDGLERICDAERALYRGFGLKRGRAGQLLGFKVWWRGMAAAILEGHGVGRLSADPWQMPGVFYLDGGVIVRQFRHRSAADRPDYSALGIGTHARD